MTSADMVPDDIGFWLLHCHVNEHNKAGRYLPLIQVNMTLTFPVSGMWALYGIVQNVTTYVPPPPTTGAVPLSTGCLLNWYFFAKNSVLRECWSHDYWNCSTRNNWHPISGNYWVKYFSHL